MQLRNMRSSRYFNGLEPQGTRIGAARRASSVLIGAGIIGATVLIAVAVEQVWRLLVK